MLIKPILILPVRHEIKLNGAVQCNSGSGDSDLMCNVQFNKCNCINAIKRKQEENIYDVDIPCTQVCS